MFQLAIDSIARLTLSRPEARNAIPAAGWTELEGKIAEVEQSGARLLIVSGEGSAFCAGADIADFEAMVEDAAATAAFRSSMRSALDKLRDLPLPTIAAIDGACYGAGVALAMACNIRMAGSAASFAITPAKMGLSYPQEDIHRLVQLTGPGQAARLLFSALSIDAAEALRIGLVDIAATDVAEELEGLASAVLSNDSGSHRALKRGMALAAAGVATDEAQDRSFDALIGAGRLAQHLVERRRAKGRLPEPER
jgi:enoyl-CoA hydratase/carnithine racemase